MQSYSTSLKVTSMWSGNCCLNAVVVGLLGALLLLGYADRIGIKPVLTDQVYKQKFHDVNNRRTFYFFYCLI